MFLFVEENQDKMQKKISDLDIFQNDGIDKEINYKNNDEESKFFRSILPSMNENKNKIFSSTSIINDHNVDFL
jgi:hypothetical protein